MERPIHSVDNPHKTDRFCRIEEKGHLHRFMWGFAVCSAEWKRLINSVLCDLPYQELAHRDFSVGTNYKQKSDLRIYSG